MPWSLPQHIQTDHDKTIYMEHVCGDDDQPSLSFTQLSFLSLVAVSGGSSHPIQTLWKLNYTRKPNTNRIGKWVTEHLHFRVPPRTSDVTVVFKIISLSGENINDLPQTVGHELGGRDRCDAFFEGSTVPNLGHRNLRFQDIDVHHSSIKYYKIIYIVPTIISKWWYLPQNSKVSNFWASTLW